MLDKNGLARHFRVSARRVDGWRARGCPALKKRGSHGSLRYDADAVSRWLASEGIVPGARGRAGARARTKRQESGKRKLKSEAASSPSEGEDEKPSPSLPYEDAKLGLEAGLRRIETLECDLGTKILRSLARKKPLEGVELLSQLRSYKEILAELRLLTKGFIAIQVLRGELVPREDLLDKTARLAAFIRGAAERFADELAGGIVTRLGEDGVEVGDIAAFQRSLHGAAQRAVDGWLQQLSDQIRAEGEANQAGVGA